MMTAFSAFFAAMSCWISSPDDAPAPDPAAAFAVKVACIVDVVVVPVVSAPRRVNGARSPRTAPATDEVVVADETVQSACGPPPPPRRPDLLLPWEPTPEAAHVLLKAPDWDAKTDEARFVLL